MAKKRGASALDDEDSDLELHPSSIPVSCTSSESVQATEDVDEIDHHHDHNERVKDGEEAEFSAVSSPNQVNCVRSLGEMDTARPSKEKDMLGLDLRGDPNSSLNTAMESSSRSSREEGNSQSQTRSSDDCQDQSKGENDSADSDYPAADRGTSSIGHQGKSTRSDLRPCTTTTTTCQPSADDVPGDTSTYSTSFTTSALSSVADEVDDHQPTLQLAIWSDCHQMPKLSSSENIKRTKVQQHTLSLKSSVPNKKPKIQQRTTSDLYGAAASTWHSLLSYDLGAAVRAQNFGLVLVRLLLSCADAVANQDLPTAISILNQLSECASPIGDSMQRVVAYFCEGLRIRVFGKGSPMISGVLMQLSPEDCLSALATLNNVTPYFRFAHFTANQAILEAVEDLSAVHIIDLDIMQGIQWPSLIQSLALRPGGPPRLRLTGIGAHYKIIKDTGRRLKSFAASCNVPFEFEAIVQDDYENLRPDVFTLRRGEAVVLNAVVMQHHHFFNPFRTGSRENALHKVLLWLCRKLTPCLVTVVERETSDNHEASFLGQFIETLDYYAAIFDSLDAAFPRQSPERLRIEMLLFWPRIRSFLSSRESVNDHHESARRLGSWEKRMQTTGFCQIPISACARIQAKLLVQSYPHDGYQLLSHKDRESLSLGWHDRSLLTISAWACHPTI